MQMVTLKSQSFSSGGKRRQVYEVCSPYTIMDCLNELVRNKNVQVLKGEREAEHDVEMDSSLDHSYYTDLNEFIASKEYEYYAGHGSLTSYYMFEVLYNGHSFSMGFSYSNKIILSYKNDEIDLCKLLSNA